MESRLPALIIMVFILLPLLTQCNVSDHRPGELAVIPESAKTVTFSGGTTWSDVVFQHTQHSDRYKGQCIKCHDHQAIAGETHWYCRSCHTAGQDSEKLCKPDQYHGCIMTQCSNCHETKGANPGMSCAGCHKGGEKATGAEAPVPAPTPAPAPAPTPTPVPTPQPPASFSKTYLGSIDQRSEVDNITIKIPASGSLVIDVDAWEGCGSKATIPTDLFAGDGASNNKLKANIYLFDNSGNLVASKVGQYPGEGAPGAHITRTGQSPYLATNITAGTYTLAIGSYPLSEADAKAGNNSGGSSWTNRDDVHQIDLYNKYRVKVVFQLP